MNYIPFEKITIEMLRNIFTDGHRYFVVQRFSWPSLPTDKTFMTTPYAELGPAENHALQLYKKEGKLLDLQRNPEKLLNLLSSEQYHVFLNTFKDKNWSAKIMQEYNSQIVSYVRSHTTFKRSEGLNIELYFAYGRLMAQLSSGNNRLILFTYDLIK